VTIETVPRESLVDFKLHKTSFKIFTKSFLGYGLMSARMSIFKAELFQQTNNQTLSSICLTSQHEGVWNQQNIDYKIIGINKRQRNYNDCYLSVKKTIENKMNVPVELRKKKIFAFSFYYDRLSTSNLIKETGGAVNVEKIGDLAKKGKKRERLINIYLKFN
jgi:hypothetical protein